MALRASARLAHRLRRASALFDFKLATLAGTFGGFLGAGAAGVFAATFFTVFFAAAALAALVCERVTGTRCTGER